MLTSFLDKMMIFNFSLTQTFPILFYCQRESFVSDIFPLSPKGIPIYLFHRVQETVTVKSDSIAISTNYILTFCQKRENRQCSFLNTGEIPLQTQNLKINIEQISILDETHELAFFVCNHTSASGNFIGLTHASQGKIIAESFKFDQKENSFYKTEKYIQPDCMTTNQPSQTELSKCHDREKIAEFLRKLPSAFSKTKA